MQMQDLVPIGENVEKVILNDKMIYTLDLSENIVQAFRVGYSGAKAGLNRQNIGVAAKKAFKREFNATAGRGWKVAKVGRFAQKYGGKAALVVEIGGGVIQTIRGIQDGNGKMVAEAVFGTAASISGGMIGASIGTYFCPGVGTIVGGIIGSKCGSKLVELIIQQF